MRLFESMVQEFANVVLIDKIVCPFSLPRIYIYSSRKESEASECLWMESDRETSVSVTVNLNGGYLVYNRWFVIL